MPTLSYPGVYIQEFEPAPPIQPANTGIAAFIGFATDGPLNTPVRVTSFQSFQSQFGSRPVNGFYLWYAVRGFFTNGGQLCYVTRVSNGTVGRWILQNASPTPAPVFNITANSPPRFQNDTLAVDAAPISTLPEPGHSLRVFVTQPVSVTANESQSRAITLGAKCFFRPGDTVCVADDVTTQFLVTAVSPSLPNTLPTIQVDTAPATSLMGKSLRLIDIQPSDNVFRFEYIDTSTNSRTKVPAGSLLSGTLLSITPPGSTQPFSGVVSFSSEEHLSDNTITYRVTFRDALGIAISSDVGVPTEAKSHEFTLTVTSNGHANIYTPLYSDAAHPTNYAVPFVNSQDSLVTIAAVDTPPPGNLLSTVPSSSLQLPPLDPAGRPTPQAEDPSTFNQSAQFLISGLDPLVKLGDVSLVAIPDAVGQKDSEMVKAIQQAIIAHCENTQDRFGILDGASANQPAFSAKNDDNSIEQQRAGVSSTRGYAALYYPWIRVLRGGSGPNIAVPPSGHIAGLMARVDDLRGVHKAPANETLKDAVDLMKDMTNNEQGVLNLEGINVIRTFTHGGTPVVFGARTTATDINWQYVNIRRLFLFLERSISQSLRASLFEPNNRDLWGTLTRVITAFLTEQWRAGALFGSKAEEAFYVKIDDSLNPFTDRQLGKLTIEIGVCPTYPAEFIVVRIGIWDGQSNVQEG